MIAVTENLHAIDHPLIASLQMKKYFDAQNRGHDVLVIEANFPLDEEDGFGTFDTHLMDLLSDLEEIKNSVENEVGHIDRVDIRTQ